MADNDSPIPPHACLIEFLDKLAPIIRAEVLFLSCFALEIADDYELANKDLLQIIREFLEEDANRQAYRCAETAGLIEMILAAPKDSGEQFQQDYEETGAEAFRDLAMRAPLREAHISRAREQFSELRRTYLSSEVLAIWRGLYRV